MKVQDLSLVIIRMEEGTDKDGCLFLKCKGYHCSRSKNGALEYDQFTSIRLYPCNEEQYNETKHRFLGQTIAKPKLKIVAYDSNLKTYLIQGKLVALLEVNKYDFEKSKIFNKRTLVKKGE